MTTSALRYDHDYFSDLYKDVHGSRPRFRLDDGALDQWEIDNYIEHLIECLDDVAEDDAFFMAHVEEEYRWADFVRPEEPHKYEAYE